MPSTASQLRSLPCSGSSQPSYACAPAGSPNTETVSFSHRPTASLASCSGFINETLGEISVAPIKPQLAYQCGQQYSITALTNSSGSIVERYAYSAYGVPTITNATGTLRSVSSYDNRYTYTGREWDDVLLMYNYRARMYDAALGRFLGRDPIRYSDGTSLYRYVSLNPLTNQDPSGLVTCTATHQQVGPPGPIVAIGAGLTAGIGGGTNPSPVNGTIAFNVKCLRSRTVTYTYSCNCFCSSPVIVTATKQQASTFDVNVTGGVLIINVAATWGPGTGVAYAGFWVIDPADQARADRACNHPSISPTPFANPPAAPTKTYDCPNVFYWF